MIELSRALSDFAVVFDKLNVPYVVMGGIAVRFYGIPRATYDVDFTVSIERDRLSDLYHLIREIGYTIPDTYDAGWVDSVAGMPLIKARLYLEGHGIDIDLFLAESRFQRQMLNRRRQEHLEDNLLWLVSPEDLVLLKLLAGRPRDYADIGDIFFTQGQLDETYLRQWARELGVLAELDRIMALQE
jgi:hypothetical protein